MIKRFVLIIIWVVLVIVLAKFTPNYHKQSVYSELISESAVATLTAQKQLKIAIFALPESPAASLVKNFLQPLMNHLPDVEVQYLDMKDNAELVDQYNINKQGEMVVINDNGEFHLSTLSYEAFFNGLKRLQQNNDDWVVFLDGLDSRSYAVGQLTGLNSWLQSLSYANYKTVVLPFDSQLKLPKQTKLLVLASPTVALSESDSDWLQEAMENGISILWLADPNTVLNQPALALLFDVISMDSFHQGQLIIKDFTKHTINKNFDRPLDLNGVLPFETSNQSLWLDDQGQTLAATREIGGARIMVIGDSDFLSNAHLNSGGNLEVSYRLVDWLLRYENRFDLPTIGIKGTQLHYKRSEILWFSGVMLILLPTLFLFLALYFWRRNR